MADDTTKKPTVKEKKVVATAVVPDTVLTAASSLPVKAKETEGVPSEISKVISEAVAFKGRTIIVLQSESDIGFVKSVDGDTSVKVNPRQQVRCLWRKM